MASRLFRALVGAAGLAGAELARAQEVPVETSGQAVEQELVLPEVRIGAGVEANFLSNDVTLYRQADTVIALRTSRISGTESDLLGIDFNNAAKVVMELINFTDSSGAPQQYVKVVVTPREEGKPVKTFSIKDGFIKKEK